MIWTCPKCNASIEVPDDRPLTYCSICGARYIPQPPLKDDAVPAASPAPSAENQSAKTIHSDTENWECPGGAARSGSCRGSEFGSEDSFSSAGNGSVPAPPPASSPRTCPPAGPWSRFAARMIDFFLANTIICTFTALFWDYTSMNNLVISMIFTPLALLLDCLVYTGFGQTPGKWIFGFQTVNDSGSLLTAGQYLQRNIQVYIRGFGLGLPFIGMCTSFYQHDLLNKGKKTNYDQILKTQVIDSRESIGRKCAGFLIFLLLFSIGFGILIFEKTNSRL